MTAHGRGDATRYYWRIAEPYLQRPGVDRGTLMGFPCLRVNGDFFTTCEHESGDLIVKLPEQRVAALIDAGRGIACAPAGRVFQEWLRVSRRNRKTWTRLMDEALMFVARRTWSRARP